MQVQNGSGVRIMVRVRGLGVRVRLALRSGLYFYFVELLHCFQYFTHSASIFRRSTLPLSVSK